MKHPVVSPRNMEHPSRASRRAPGLVHFLVGTALGTAPAVDLPLSSQVRAIEMGLPQSELVYLQNLLDLPAEKLGALVGLSKSTLHRKKAMDSNLDPVVSDRVVRYARLLGKAIHVFGNQDDANHWLRSPQFGLGGEIPLDYARTEIGAREVENLLGRIEFGVYA